MRTLNYALLISLLTFSIACDKTSKKTPASHDGKTKVEDTAKTKKNGEKAGLKTDMFTTALNADPETLDPGKMSGAPEGRLAFQIFEGLMMPSPTTEGLSDASKLVTYGAAESHTVSDDGKTYTFKIRKDSKWSDGSPLNAHDFVYSWKRVLTKETGADYVSMLHIIENAKAYTDGKTNFENVGIKAKDDYTLVVKLTNPTPYFLELVAFYTYFPVPKAAVEKHAEKWTRPENIVSNGAYNLATYEPQKKVILKANKHYWDQANVKIKDVKLSIITDANARVNAYKTGQLHWTGAGLPVAQIAGLLAHEDYFQEPLLGVYYFRLNVSKEGPLTNPKIREALSLAIDRNSLVDNTLNGMFTVADSYVPPIAGYSSITKTSYNIKKAKDLLAEAGFPKGKGFPKVSLLYNTDENHKLVAESVQAMWKRNLGIDITLNNKEWATYLADVDSLSYEIARAGWIGDYNDPHTFLSMWKSDDGNNDTGWKNSKYDELIDSIESETDKAKRVTLMQQAEKILLTEGPIIPIYFYTNNMLRSTAIKGFKAHNRDVHLFKYMSID